MPERNPKNIVGERVKKARFRQKPPLTQDQLSGKLARIGVTVDRVGISKIENGTRRVMDFEVRGLSKVLGVSPGWLLGMNE